MQLILKLMKYFMVEFSYYFLASDPQKIKVWFSNLNFELKLPDDMVQEILNFRHDFFFNNQPPEKSVIRVNGEKFECEVEISWFGKINLKTNTQLLKTPTSVDVDLST